MHIDTGNLRIHCELSGDGTPLVLTHGLGSDLHYWDAFLEPLERHHRVLRWDVRGFGESDKPAGPYSPALFAADLAALLDALHLDRVHLAGISMGGVIAQRFALDFPQRLRSLILVSTSSEVGEKAVANWNKLADMVEQKGFDDRSADASRSFAAAFAARHPEIVRQLSERTRANDPHSYAAAARAVGDYGWTAELRAVITPALVLQGLDDQLTPPGGSVKMCRALPHGRLLLLPACGHNLPVEQPTLFWASVLSFTAGIDGAADSIAQEAPVC